MKHRHTYRLLIILGFLSLSQLVFAQLTFVINELPENHDYSKSIYISGDFEGWSGGLEANKLIQTDQIYSISLPLDQEIIHYKFTMGSWESVERDADGGNSDNRIYKRLMEKDTVYIKIVNWDQRLDESEGRSTAAENVTIISEDFEIPELNRTRRIWMYLPPDYHTSEENYPVLYMHDGQNVFDAKTAYAGEWSVDETLNRLFRLNNFKLIVVAIDNAGDKRMNEYSPWDNERFGKAEGEAYVNFIANTLKPYIDSKFRTLSDNENTGIMGSSLGGLISHYAALKYPNVFGKAGVFSPSFWYAKEAYDFSSSQAHVKDLKMYFLVGGNEGDTMVPDMIKMIDLLKGNGLDQEQVKQKIVDEGIHNEKFWEDEFEDAILWMFPNALKKRTFIQANLNESNQLEVDVSDGKYVIQFYDSEIVETTFIPKGQEFVKESHAVSMKPQNGNELNFKKESGFIRYGSPELSVHIDKSPFQLRYLRHGKVVTYEKPGYQRTDAFETLRLSLTEDEILYGGGARALGMNRRGNRLRLYNRADYGYETRSELMNYTLPIMMSSKMYMIHFDNAPIGYLDLDSKDDNTITYETISGRKTYQVIVSDSWLGLIDNYTDLTGKQPLPPRWAFGNFASRFGYHSEKETRATVQAFKEEKIPLDAVIIDIYWFGKDIKGHMGNLEFHRDSFPNPKKMISDFKRNGVKTVLVSEPFILTSSKRWQEAVDQNILATDSIGNPFTYDFYFGNTGLIDVYDENAKSWFWNIYKGLAEMGVEGVWGDLGEPEVHPSDLVHATGTADEVHNTYGHDWAKLIYEGYVKDFPDSRPFILMRSGASGSQRFGLIPWSGDVNRSWGGLQSQTEIALQMGMQGLGYMHSDLGGFAGANLDDELYSRWLQYGVFQPIFRPHAQEEVPSEPVFREAKTMALAKRSIELRYRMLPYNYTLAFENSSKGSPFMRPLFFEEHDNEQLLTNSDTYMWGNDILVTPIINSNINEKQVYFPKSASWFNFYTDEEIEGGQMKMVAINEYSIPTFIRAGAFIPMAKPMQTTDEYNDKTIELHYYHDDSVENSKGMLYNDDGKTPLAYNKGQYEISVFKSKFKPSSLELFLLNEKGKNYRSNMKSIDLVIHNVDKGVKRVKVNKRSNIYNYNENTKILSIPLDWKRLDPVHIEIKLKK